MNKKKVKKAAAMIARAYKEEVPSTWGMNHGGEKRRRANDIYRIDNRRLD